MGNHLAGAALVSFTCHSAPRKNSTCNIMSGLNIEEPCECPACQAWSRTTWPAQSSEPKPRPSASRSEGGRERESGGSLTSPEELTFLVPPNLFGGHISYSHPLQHSNVSTAGPGCALHSHILAQRRVALSEVMLLWGEGGGFQWAFSMHSKWFPTDRV